MVIWVIKNIPIVISKKNIYRERELKTTLTKRICLLTKVLKLFLIKIKYFKPK